MTRMDGRLTGGWEMEGSLTSPCPVTSENDLADPGPGMCKTQKPHYEASLGIYMVTSYGGLSLISGPGNPLPSTTVS